MKDNNKYWKGLEELEAAPEFEAAKENEFPENIVMGDTIDESVLGATSDRRDFLKMLGFSVTAATIAAGCEMPVRKAIPYLIKPEEIIPGEAIMYASTSFEGGEYCSTLVKVRDGRPIKIEGNKMSHITQGVTSARVQASVLGLYDTNRLRGPLHNGEPVTWEDSDIEIKKQLNTIAGKGQKIVILSSTIISPSTKQVIADFKTKYPTTEHITYDAISCSGIIMAHEKTFNSAVLPKYNIRKADVIVSFGADFLGTWISPIEFAKEYSFKRKVDKDNPKMSKVYSIESNLSLTGSNADERYMIKPSHEGDAIIQLYNAIAGKSGANKVSGGKSALKDDVVEAIAKDLWSNKSKSLVISGSNNVNVQVLVNAINHMLNNYGRTLDISKPSNLRQGSDMAVKALIDNMNNGTVGALIVYGANPAYDLPLATAFNSGLEKVSLTVSFADRNDETASKMEYVCPDHHGLESWNDFEPYPGNYSLSQPTIAPLFDTRAAQESLLTWADAENTVYYKYIQNHWQTNILGDNISFQSEWDESLRDGVYRKNVEGTEVEYTGDAGVAASALLSANSSKESNVELVLYEKTGLGNGFFANNPWLQEMPDPISKVTWDNYALVSEDLANKYGVQHEVDNKNKKVFTISDGNNSMDLPVVIIPGLQPNTVAVALGYGRTAAGRAGDNVGKNAYPFASFDGETFNYNLANISIQKSSAVHLTAITQIHHNINIEERPVVRETLLEDYKSDRYAGTSTEKEREKLEEIRETSLYNFGVDHEYNGHHWGMSIDLNSCIGCGACIVACQAENNIPVVGKKEVARKHEMHWIRIDRYFYGNKDNPNVIHSPMLCQHCDNAPCENVCPVSATTHSDEGLNQMIYNRCIGTRYCANNCPYKVRRFNWFDYQSQDSFGADTIIANEHDPLGMTEDLPRMVLNPDVTVRSRGVMEKCTFCVQKIQVSKLTAKDEGRPLKDHDIEVACEAACPTNAIVFGDMNDLTSRVALSKKDERNFHVLEEIHVVPSIGYLTKVRNTKQQENA
ncbi:MAG: TAT-variant-translocated molybdopterin oxidoreductase [Bacteroidetes bacterium]|nr:TAT-variant-translocated molybdopterin oxidoreductase [Bacteroidota bacterium]